MDYSTLLTQIIQVCIIPCMGILVKFFVSYLIAKKDELKAATDNVVAKKYLDMITQTITDCVIATNQTYTNTLKEQGAFTKEAQEEAFNKTLNAVLAILNDDTKEYLAEATGDITVYLTQLIEAEVNKQKG